MNAGVVASAGRRLAGFFLDIAAWVVMCLTVEIMIIGVLEILELDNNILAAFGLLIWFSGTIVFFFILLAQSKSYGKWFLGMKVYRVSGKPAGFFIMLVRETIGKFVSGLIFGLGYLRLLWDTDRQIWHDKVVGTVVMVPGAKNHNIKG